MTTQQEEQQNAMIASQKAEVQDTEIRRIVMDEAIGTMQVRIQKIAEYIAGEGADINAVIRRNAFQARFANRIRDAFNKVNDAKPPDKDPTVNVSCCYPSMTFDMAIPA